MRDDVAHFHGEPVGCDQRHGDGQFRERQRHGDDGRRRLCRDVGDGDLRAERDKYAGHNGPPANETTEGFVNELYQVVLGRAPDPDGKAFWIGALAQTSRADVALDFAISTENQAQDAALLGAGVFAPDPVASDVARLYYAILDRAPDAAGLSFWTDAVKGGAAEAAVAQTFVDSPEHQAWFGMPNDPTFIDEIYEGALGRHPTPAETTARQAELTSGQSRGTVALGIANGPEANAYHLAEIEQGWHTV